MKKLFWGLLLLPLLSFAPHKFYVSKTIIEFNPRSMSYEVTCKIFTDDLERAISKPGEAPIRLGTDRERVEANGLIEQYIRNHFIVLYNNERIELSFLGKESEADLTYCYFEFVRPQEYNTISIESTLLLEHYPEQQNIVDLRANGSSKTVILTQQHPKEVIFR